MRAKLLRAQPLDAWVERTKRLLQREQQEEIELMQQELAQLDDAANPNVLPQLRVTSVSTGLFGSTLVKCAFPSLHLQKPKPHHFTVGDLVQLRIKKTAASSSSKQQASEYPTGIVTHVDDSSIALVLGEGQDVEENELLSQSVTMDRLVNNATFVKISSALDRMAKFDYGQAQNVVEVYVSFILGIGLSMETDALDRARISVFSGKMPSWNLPLPEIQPIASDLNDSQLDAIRFALASKDLALIHGPPGTGKTTTVVELIVQAVHKYQMKILVCAPSNIAVDNVLEKLASSALKAKKKLQLTRIGHPARVLPQILQYCLDAKIQEAEGTEIVNDIRKEMASMQSKLTKTKDKSVRFQLRREIKDNRKEIRKREQNVVVELLKHSDVVFATNVGAASKLLNGVTFDLVIIDEAAQALEASCWIPILKAKRCVLAGDHLQLPPTIKSKSAAADGLEITLFDRITRFESTQSVVKMLKIQYRMHEDISSWSSKAMYQNELASFEGVANRKLHELSHVHIDKDDELLNATLLLLDTAGCDLEEDADEEQKNGNNLLALSKSNEGEARVVARHVRALLDAGLKQEEVAVITPYNKQVQVLKAMLVTTYPKLEIRSVDGFQGCEKEAVVMSLVRSNAAKQVGFLADDRRMNVAITRAKRHVAVVCDTDTISAHKFLDVLVKHFEAHGEYHSAQEYLEEDAVFGSTSHAELQALQTASSSAGNPHAPKAERIDNGASEVGAQSKQSVKKSALSNKKAQSKNANAARSAQVLETKPVAVKVDEPKAEHADNHPVKTLKEEEASEEEDDSSDLEEKKPSVFQMMAHSDSSSDSDEANDDESEQSKASLVAPDDDLKAASSLLKELHASRMARLPPPPPAAVLSNKKSKKKKKKSSNPATAPVAAVQDGESELDFLEREAKSSSNCSFQSAARCKKSTSMMGSVCRFCKLKFCYNHAMPEIHGCGDAVREFERTQFTQQMRAPVSDKRPLTADKRKLLKKKLDEKVTEKTATRTTKTKSKKK